MYIIIKGLVCSLWGTTIVSQSKVYVRHILTCAATFASRAIHGYSNWNLLSSNVQNVLSSFILYPFLATKKGRRRGGRKKKKKDTGPLNLLGVVGLRGWGWGERCWLSCWGIGMTQATCYIKPAFILSFLSSSWSSNGAIS